MVEMRSSLELTRGLGSHQSVGKESVLVQFQASKRNLDIYEKISHGMLEKGHNRDAQQCRVLRSDLRQAYQKTWEANSHSGSSPKTCHFYGELYAILSGDPTTVPPCSIDTAEESQSRSNEEDFVDEEDDDEESRVQESGVSIFPESQDLFVTPEQLSHTQDSGTDRDAREGISVDTSVFGPPCRTPAERLSQIRKQKKQTNVE
ncbi:uncharacterized protein [Emydura macquarii macquarii]|uniref:uncharacterized protein n=1 Tax=Emydura macquarii macquarii TaxID=1129001 RepID=UPI003529E934